MECEKTTILLLVFAALLTACSSAATPCSEAEIGTGENGLPDLGGCEFTFAVENAYLPFNYVDPTDGVAKGWDYDVFNYMAELMNFTPVYVPFAWDGMIQAVADGQFDIAGDGITITAERDEIIDFSDGYINLAQRKLFLYNQKCVFFLIQRYLKYLLIIILYFGRVFEDPDQEL